MTGVEIEGKLTRGELKLLGAGSRRECYAIPGTGLCLKCYREESAAPNATVAREIRKYRHDEKRNTCAEEYRYWLELKAKLPAYVFAAFPDSLELIHLPTRGFALLESRVENEDGSACTRFSLSYRLADAATRAKLLKEFWLLVGAFAAYGVRFYDTQNIVVQRHADNTFRLRVVDFEPAARTLIPIDALCPAIMRGKVIRRAVRYLAQHCGVKARYKGLPARLRRKWDTLIATEGAKMGLTDCVAFLENKQVNDIFYEGRYNGIPCVVKCSSRAPDSIANEYRLAQRVYEVDSRICEHPLALHEGPMAFVVVEKISGLSLSDWRFSKASELGDVVDGIADDFVRMAEALKKTGISHRDLGTTDNYLQGSDGHFKLIDFQFAVDRALGFRDPWLILHPRYHFAVMSCQLCNGNAYWNDIGYLVGHLRYRLPSTPHVKSVADRLTQEVDAADFFVSLGCLDRLSLFRYRFGLRLQKMFANENSPKLSTLNFRLSRFEERGRSPVR